MNATTPTWPSASCGTSGCDRRDATIARIAIGPTQCPRDRIVVEPGSAVLAGSRPASSGGPRSRRRTVAAGRETSPPRRRHRRPGHAASPPFGSATMATCATDGRPAGRSCASRSARQSSHLPPVDEEVRRERRAMRRSHGLPSACRSRERWLREAILPADRIPVVDVQRERHDPRSGPSRAGRAAGPPADSSSSPPTCRARPARADVARVRDAGGRGPRDGIDANAATPVAEWHSRSNGTIFTRLIGLISAAASRALTNRLTDLRRAAGSRSGTRRRSTGAAAARGVRADRAVGRAAR